MKVAAPPQIYILQQSCHHTPEPINLNPEPSFLFSIVFSEANFNILKFIFIWKRTILQTVKGSGESFL